MKAKEIARWYEYLKEKGLSVEEGLILSLMSIGENYEKNDFNSLIDKGFVDESGMLTSKAFKLKFISSENNSEVIKLSEKIREIFPKQIIPTSKLPARSSISEIVNKIKWFKSNYAYTEDQILQAVSEYVDTFSKDNYKYMQTASYFISKQNKETGTKISNLALWCENQRGKEDEKFDIDI